MENHSFAKAHAAIENENHFLGQLVLGQKNAQIILRLLFLDVVVIAIVVVLHDHLIH